MTTKTELSMRKMIIAMVGLGVLAIFLTSYAKGVYVPTAKERVASTSAESGMMSSVAPLMAKLKDNPNDKDALLQLAYLFDRAEEWVKAEPFWGKVVALDQTNIGARYHHGFALAQLNRLPEAVSEYEAILKAKPEEAVAHYYLGMINKHGLKKPDVAKKHFKQALALKPDDKELLAEIEEELASMK